MNDTTLPTDERIHAFADAVRAELADLPVEDIDDLIEGLVGDLTDQAEDHGGEIELGDPAAYAQELRTAAGLPERGPVTTTKVPWHERLAAQSGRSVGRIRSSAFGSWVLDLLIALRPVWWILRGLALAALIAIPAGLGPRTIAGYGGFPAQVLVWAIVLAIVLVSVQWGRGRWLPRNALRHVRTIASVLALLFLPALFGYATSSISAQAYGNPGYRTPPTPGLALDGNRVVNLFVYDKDGSLIPGAQIYTNRGTPLNLMGRYGEQFDSAAAFWGPGDSGTTTLPFRDAQERPVWNVYPLQLGRIDDATGQLDPSTTLTPQPPFLRAPDRALTATPAPTPGSTMSPAPTPAPTPVPSPSPVPTPTSTPAG
ncbi:hypothetical protein [Microbacterium panaciterrae]|uniref:Uncharacterized protein n=1 Tax=Microbacterium panaciterrae TaxID=985759 RepID=A0ABP8PRJ3_9MICO